MYNVFICIYIYYVLCIYIYVNYALCVYIYMCVCVFYVFAYAITLPFRCGYCKRHGRTCDIRTNPAASNLLGSPCTAYSSMGYMDAEEAMSFAYFLAWSGLRRILQEPVICQECTEGFPRDLFTKLLPMYDFMAEMLDPYVFGWPVKRPRQWMVSLI